MIKNIIFDYGGVLLDWNPHYLYDPYFGDVEKAEWFLNNICTYEWNAQHDNGKPIAEGTAELIAEHPEWEREIRLYYDDFMKMMGGQIPGMEELVKGLKVNGYRVFGLSNWSVETFALVRPVYPVLNLMEDMVISGVEKVMKPDHRIFELALNRFGIKAEETIFLDDNPVNVQAAREMGIKGILFNKNMIKNEKAILNTDGSLVLPEWLRQD
ncbi:MAG: HAD family phosphatase [Bacteroidales bacterium]|nr:HAD family phosphatase [Bacteroidales bacterium]